jgi:hypothetical protein
MKRLTVVCILLVLAGCGTTSGGLGGLPSITDEANAAKIVVVRVSSLVGATNGYTVALDGSDVFGIGSGEHAEFLVPQGEHYIAVKCFGGWTPTWKADSLKFDAKAAQTHFFLIRPDAKCAEIKPSTQAEAGKHLATSKLVDVHEPDSSASAQAPLRDVPSLKVETDCGACEVRASVPGLIVEGYTSAAAESGAKPASGEQVTVSIKEYSSRDDVARHLLGVFAGKDEIKATVSLHGRQLIVTDY